MPTMDDPRGRVFDALDALGIRYERTSTRLSSPARMPPSTGRPIPATPVKNLFLRNKKGDRHYLRDPRRSTSRRTCGGW